MKQDSWVVCLQAQIKLWCTYVVGSSKNSIGGLSNNSNAIDKRFRCPPDRFEHFVFLANVKCSRFRICVI